jgi:adenylate cyclase
MTSKESVKTPFLERILELSKLAGQVRDQVLLIPQADRPALLEKISSLENSLIEVNNNAGIFEEESFKLMALAETTRAVNSSLNLDEVLCIVMDTIVQLTKAERGFLMLMDPQGEMVTRIARNWDRESIQAPEYAISRTIVQRVVQTGETILTTNAQEDPRFLNQESIITHNLRSILCVPLKVKGELIGVLYADNRIRSGIFTGKDRDLITAFANQAALAIENARLFESIQATLAEVTELKNLMENIFASVASGVITTDVQNQITLCNRAAELMLGLTRPEIIGRPLSDFLPSLARDIQPYLVAVMTSEKQVTDLEFTNNLPERGYVNWRINLAPLKDANQITRGVTMVFDDLTERKKLEAHHRLLERMVSPAVLNQLDPNDLPIGGNHTDITILFADIRGFTGFSENHTPEELVVVLNHYLAAAAEAILAEEGTVDKYLGDSVMAWFNAPLLQPDHTLRAVRAALEIRISILALHAKLPPEAHLSFGVGIHYGDAVLGLIGTEKRIDYTAIGDSVNTTKRIQENSTINQILISAEAYRNVKDLVEVRPVSPLRLKGKANPVQVYELLGLQNSTR